MSSLTMVTGGGTILFMTDWLTVKEAAKKTGYNFQYLRRLCRKNRLAHVLKGRTYLIEPESLEQYVKKMRLLGTEKHDPTRAWADEED